jgi:Glycosyltransferase family 87
MAFDRMIPRSVAFQLVCGLLLIGALGLTVARVVRQYHPGGVYSAELGGMADYHNGVFFPAMALRDGVSPYGNEFASRYPVARPTPPFSPFVIAYHIPLTYLALPISDAVYFTIIALSLFGIGWLALRESGCGDAVWWLVPLWLTLVISRSGHVTLLNGYFTAELVIGTMLALRYAKKKPWLSAIGILFASGKPTYAIPIVMLARGNLRALSMGVALSIVGALIPAAWLASGIGWQGLIESVRQGQALHMADSREFPVNTWTRIDMVAILAKWTKTNPSELVQLGAMLPLMLLPAWALNKLRRRGDADGVTTLSGAIAATSLLVTLYHHVYDALLLPGPVVGVLLSGHETWQRISLKTKLILAILLTGSWWNYFSSEIILVRLPDWNLLRQAIASANAIMLVVALGWLIKIALSETEEVSDPKRASS